MNRFGSHLGIDISAASSPAEALRLSGQDFEVLKDQLQHNGYDVPAYGIFRADTGHMLGVCGEDYTPIQNAEQLSVIDSIISAAPSAHYETAGVVGHGEKVWTSVRLPSTDFTIGEADKHEVYLLVTTSHDSSVALSLKLVDFRITCSNAIVRALRGEGAIARIRHTKTAQARIELAKKYLTSVDATAASLAEVLNTLNTRAMTRESMEQVLTRLFPPPVTEATASQTRRDNILSEILALYEQGDGTAYSLLNAVTDYTDHLRGSRLSDEKREQGYTPERARAESALFGSGERLKSKALEVILEATASNPIRQVAVQETSSTPAGLLDEVLEASS